MNPSQTRLEKLNVSKQMDQTLSMYLTDGSNNIVEGSVDLIAIISFYYFKNLSAFVIGPNLLPISIFFRSQRASPIVLIDPYLSKW